MSPFELYVESVTSGVLEKSPEQELVLHYLADVQQKLNKRKKSRGLYLWGGVGVGKTLIMDFFYQSLTAPKLRLHFHAFMSRLHQELYQSQGQKNPLTVIGKRMASQYAVICFDEFIVTNVADAMLLAELFKTLFKKGVCLIITANLAPEKLYEQGLQRQRFLPVIDLIQEFTQVWHLNLPQDYRQQVLRQMPVYFTPLGEEAERAMHHAWQSLAANHSCTSEPLTVLDRDIPVLRRSDQAVWFEFNKICGRPRSSQDYLALAEQFSVVMVSHVPYLEKASPDLVVSFIHLVDVLYDARVKLVISAEVPIAELYRQGQWRALFQRTESRLLEMQSYQYQIQLGLS